MSATSDYYLARADECAREAELSTLENVRERSRRSELAWRQMAERLVRAETVRADLLAAKDALRVSLSDAAPSE